MKRALYVASMLIVSTISVSAQDAQQYPLTGFDELIGDWVNQQGSQVTVDRQGRVSTYVGSNGLSGRVAPGVTPGGGNFGFAGRVNNVNYFCGYNIIFTDSGSSAIWTPVDESGTRFCPRGLFLRSH